MCQEWAGGEWIEFRACLMCGRDEIPPRPPPPEPPPPPLPVGQVSVQFLKEQVTAGLLPPHKAAALSERDGIGLHRCTFYKWALQAGHSAGRRGRRPKDGPEV